jgi:hypothetical protein
VFAICWSLEQKQRGYNMSVKRTKQEIGHLKDELKATYRKNDLRLLKMTLLMVILAVIAALVYGRLQLW